MPQELCSAAGPKSCMVPNPVWFELIVILLICARKLREGMTFTQSICIWNSYYEVLQGMSKTVPDSRTFQVKEEIKCTTECVEACAQYRGEEQRNDSWS